MFSADKKQYEDKPAQYRELCSLLEPLIAGEPSSIANLANASALLAFVLEDINWAGFYLYDTHCKELVLGPFQGKPACVRIPMGRGVCGTAAQEECTKLVQDVHQFPGHIACDAASRSEIVVPMYQKGCFFGVLDIDSPIQNRFDQQDQLGLEQFVKILEKQL